MTAEKKMWGKREFWGISEAYDPDWMLTKAQKELRTKLIELCRVKIRPHAIHCDKTYTYPRESMDALAELGILGLSIPKNLGGLGENHVCASMVVETIARYGCPSTAMVLTMHFGALAIILFRHHGNKKLTDLLKRINKEKLIGTESYSDPATGGHVWFPLSSKVRPIGIDRVKVLRYCSWATSCGFADWYCLQTVSPNFTGDYSNLSVFLVFKDEIRANTDDWAALGMHGNQSGPLVIDDVLNIDRMVGPEGDGAKSNSENVDPWFLICSSSCWNGMSLACMDVAKKHVTRKSHADMGIRVCDYPTIQDYFGDCLTNANASRFMVLSVCQQLDQVTNNNDWSIYTNLNHLPKSAYHAWIWQCKLFAAKIVTEVSDVMLHACGGSGYKNDLGLERLLRDAKAAWVMGPSNEVLRQFIGKSSLLGMEVLDIWEQRQNDRILNHELSKMTLTSKKALAQKLTEDIQMEESGTSRNHPYQDTDFENPFNTAPPTSVKTFKSSDGACHEAGLNPDSWTSLKLRSKTAMTDKMGSFVFDLPRPNDQTGCLPGQYIQIKVVDGDREHTRYFSPVSRPDDFGKIELVLRYESSGFMSNHFRNMQPGSEVSFLGPCGGFEYKPSELNEMTLLASGGGITPGLQLIRCVMNNPLDKTSINLIYYSDSYDEILYRDELDKYAASDKRLRILHTLGESPEQWDGEEGFIDTGMIDKYVIKPNGIKHKVIMCGGPTMTISCLHSLKSLGYPSESVFIYGQFGAEQVRTVFGRKSKLSDHKSATA